MDACSNKSMLCEQSMAHAPLLEQVFQPAPNIFLLPKNGKRVEQDTILLQQPDLLQNILRRAALRLASPLRLAL
ncbi:MAG: hypothetical protein C4523_12975 [Myxococcales bacterium]|nr:MAG: hypothetical protein C4523_12975 [Myxococcales bacterium]